MRLKNPSHESICCISCAKMRAYCSLAAERPVSGSPRGLEIPSLLAQRMLYIRARSSRELEETSQADSAELNMRSKCLRSFSASVDCQVIFARSSSSLVSKSAGYSSTCLREKNLSLPLREFISCQRNFLPGMDSALRGSSFSSYRLE